MKVITFKTAIIFALLFFLLKEGKAQWQSIGGPLNHVNKIVIDNGEIIVATNYGIYYSDDNGNNWNRSDTAWVGNEVRCLQVDDTVLYAGTNESIYSISPNDSAWTWNCSNSDNTTAIYADGNKLFTANKNGLYYSSNYGQNITNINGPLGGDKYSIDFDNYISAIIEHNQKIYLGTEKGLYQSSNNGTSWEIITTPFPIVKSMVDTKNRIYLSNDENGIYYFLPSDNIIHVDTSGLSNFGINTLETDGELIFAGTDNGIFYKKVDDNKWAFLSNELTNKRIFEIGIEDSLMCIDTDAGLYISTDKGNTWHTIAKGWQKYANAISIETYYDKIIAGTKTDGVYISSDGGNTWVNKRKGLPKLIDINSITYYQNKIYLGTSHGLYISENAGETWRNANKGITPELQTNRSGILNCIVADTMVVVSAATNVWRSSVHAENWQPCQNFNTPNGIIGTASQFRLLGKSILGTFSENFLISNDYGKNWINPCDYPRFNQLCPPSLATALYYQGTLYAGTYIGQAVFVSHDTGRVWTNYQNGLPFYYHTNDFIGYGNNIFMAGSIGVYISSDSGKTWNHFNENLLDTTVQVFALKNNILYIGTATGGIYKRTLDHLSANVQPQKEISLDVFPNPVTNKLLNVNVLDDIEVYELNLKDLIGNTLFTKQCNGSTQFMLKDLPSGMYLVEVKLQSSVVVRKIVLE